MAFMDLNVLRESIVRQIQFSGFETGNGFKALSEERSSLAKLQRSQMTSKLGYAVSHSAN